MPVVYELHNEVAVVSFDNPPLNIFAQAMRVGLTAAIACARIKRPERLILRGTGRAFVACSGGPTLWT
jgi:3-hydroxyacyl-CoA dehydrogenase